GTGVVGVGRSLGGPCLGCLTRLLGFVDPLLEPGEVAVDLFPVIPTTDEIEDGAALIRAAQRQQVGVLTHTFTVPRLARQ
ncbi:MAG: hypothetical protein QOC80_2155, partial [Frankiaceae bacterium]|nr:hypothetical protein [Frankiaceae bacterium]